MPRALFITATVLIAAGLGRAAPTPEQIQGWVRDLDNSSFKTRDLAARSLRQAGADAAPALARAAKSGGVEAADRALRILGEMAEGPDTRAEAAARRQLRRLADGESHVAGDARALLHRKRSRMLAQLAFAGAVYQETRDGLTSLELDEVGDLDSVLPLLQHFPELEAISLSNRRFTDAGAAHLVALPNMRELNLYRSNIGDEGLKHLAKIKNLRWLPMGETRVTDKGLEIIAGMTQLEYVGVRGNKVTDAGLVHLKDLTGLTGLYLGETKVTDAGLKHLAPLLRLKTLYLHTTAVTDAGLEHLKDHKDLRDLYLAETRTTSEGRERLKEALPDLRIEATSRR